MTFETNRTTYQSESQAPLTVMFWDLGAFLLVFILRAVSAGVRPSPDATPKQVRIDRR